MKTINIRNLQKQVKTCIDKAQEDKIIVTRYGKPTALIIGLEGQDWESVFLETDNDFWKLIQKRRQQETISLDELKKQI